MWEKKLVADEVDDQKGTRRDNMGPFVFEYLMGVFGLKKLAEKNAKDIVAALMLNEKQGAKANCRMRIFAIMTGVLKPELYSPKLADMVLQILGRLIPLWKSLSEFLDHRDSLGELLFSKTKIRAALMGGDKYTHEAKKRNGGQDGKHNCCMLVQLLQDLGMTEELDNMMETIMKPVGDGGCYRDSELKDLEGGITCIDFDLVLMVLLNFYEMIVMAERAALEAVAIENDINHDDSIELDEFRVFTNAIMPGHYNERRVVKLFNNMCSIFVSDENSEDTVSYHELSLYCISHGLYVSPAWKKIAKDFNL
jgi:hypothetical protein